jgi:hypothetical protein
MNKIIKAILQTIREIGVVRIIRILRELGVFRSKTKESHGKQGL